MNENSVSKFLKGYAIFNAVVGIIGGVWVSSSEMSRYTDMGAFSFIIISGIAIVISAFIYAIGEIIQLLEDIKQNTSGHEKSIFTPSSIESERQTDLLQSQNINEKNEIVNYEKSRIDYPDGSVYQGDIVDDQPEGFGTMIYAYGNKYVGQWKNGKCSGQGTLTLAVGSPQTGLFENNKFIRKQA